MDIVKKYSGVVGAGVVAAAGVALVWHRRSLALALVARRFTPTTRRSVVLVTSAREWEDIASTFLNEALSGGVVGLDCEWVTVQGGRRDVALLQLATTRGLCVLVRLTHLHAVPPSLQAFLEDENILKVGVATIEDGNFLMQDYGIKVRGCVDLRHLVLQHWNQSDAFSDGLDANDIKPDTKAPTGLGLNALAETYVGRTLDKDWRVRASDWEADTLTRRQMSYAAEDAAVAVDILLALVQRLWRVDSLVLALSPARLWQNTVATAIHNVCWPYKDVKFTSNKQNQATDSLKASTVQPSKVKPTDTESTCKRKGILYHNCQLRAPDDEPLCTIDPRKAWWYVDKGLGTLVSEDPLVVRLKFEPAGRPQAEKEDGQFYLQTRNNVCVVCGTAKTYKKKNVVPHEYRKFFPKLLKHHQNHDVVLLCTECHRRSNMHDHHLRKQLAEECEAPYCVEIDVKVAMDKPRKAAWALLKKKSNIPQERLIDLQNTVKEYLGIDEITEADIKAVASMDVPAYHRDDQAHGHKVYEAYANQGLTKLEQRWRQHFLTTMNPQHLPPCWSVNHNVYKMQLKMGRLPLDHPDREVYKLALVGRNGHIDIPYNPNQGRKVVESQSIHSDDDLLESGSDQLEYEDESN